MSKKANMIKQLLEEYQHSNHERQVSKKGETYHHDHQPQSLWWLRDCVCLLPGICVFIVVLNNDTISSSAFFVVAL